MSYFLSKPNNLTMSKYKREREGCRGDRCAQKEPASFFIYLSTWTLPTLHFLDLRYHHSLTIVRKSFIPRGDFFFSFFYKHKIKNIYTDYSITLAPVIYANSDL